ncbi:MAG: glycosyltransferase family 4 protein [Bryobacterales bacterium]
MRVLFLSAWFPYPHDNGSKLRIFNLLRGLSQKHEVTLYSLSERPEEPTPAPLAEICREVVAVESRPYRAGSSRALMGLLSPTPRVLVDRHSQEMYALIKRAVDERRFDVIVASQWYMAAYLEGLEGTPAIFDEIELGVFEQRVAEASGSIQRFRHELTTIKLRRYFENLLPRFGACTVASPEEATLLEKRVPGYPNTVVIPNGISLADCQGEWGESRADELVFAGSFTYVVNHHAMQWFTGSVLPLIHEHRPQVRLRITGNHADLPLPYMRNVELAGMLPDVRPAVAGAWASLAPLLVGGGTRLKILESMALGTPVIATSKGAEGLQARDGEHLLIADTAPDFAAATLRLLGDEDLRRRLSENAQALVRETYDWPVILPQFLGLVEKVAAGASERVRAHSV